MQTFHESRVEPADIDNLGHMNVRVYARKAAQATHALVASLGLDANALLQDGSIVQAYDNHVRFYKEQMEGAPLKVIAGVISAAPEAITVYLELLNAETGDRAATFNNVIRLEDPTTRASKPFADEIIQQALTHIVDWPDYGRPRSLPLEPVRTDITLQMMADKQVMVRLEPYTLDADDCDSHGFMNLQDGTSLAFAKLPIKIKQQRGSARGWGDDNMAIATMESRQVLLATPKLGDTIVTRSAHLAVGDKTVHSVHWSFNEATGAPVSMISQIGLGFDLTERRARSFPPQMRAVFEESIYPELA
jgi:acyl-CoA thioester hydrolase